MTGKYPPSGGWECLVPGKPEKKCCWCGACGCYVHHGHVHKAGGLIDITVHAVRCTKAILREAGREGK